jgi:hypothetical protein
MSSAEERGTSETRSARKGEDDPPTKDPTTRRDRKEWWLKLCERLIGPILWLLARLIDKAIEHSVHHG